MEVIKITISKENNIIYIRSSQGKQIEITDTNKELKATEIIGFLNYSKETSYSLEPLTTALATDKNVLSIHMIFKEIIEKLNPVLEENADSVYPF